MTPPDSSRADDRHKWLAGYADGELDEAARRQVEGWLADDPEAADALRDQEHLSPANRELWEAVAPPEPPPVVWAGVTDRVAAAVLPAPRRGSAVRRWGVRFGGAAAAVLAGVTAYEGLNSPAPQPVATPPRAVVVADADDPLAGFAVLPIAEANEVEILAVRGPHPDRFLVGEHPFPDAFTLAGPGDVTLDGPDPQMSAGPGDAPMIFPRPR